MLKELYSDTAKLSSTKCTETEFETTKGGYRRSFSTESGITGHGADYVILDDIQEPEDACDPVKREILEAKFREKYYSRLDPKSQGRLILIMQRLHPNDFSGVMLDRGNWKHLSLPLIAEKDEDIPIGSGLYHSRKTGDVLNPDYEPLSTVLDIKKEVGETVFRTQYQQDPDPANVQVIDPNWFEFFRKDATKHCPGPHITGNYYIVQSWDTASSTEGESSHSVCTTWEVRGASYRLLDVKWLKVPVPLLHLEALELARKWRPAAILVENASSGIGLSQYLAQNRRKLLPRPTTITPVGSKLDRMLNVQDLIKSGKVFVPADADWLKRLFMEMGAFPTGPTDLGDSISQALNWAKDRNSPPLFHRQRCQTPPARRVTKR